MGELAGPPGEREGFLEAADRRRRMHEHRAVTIDELGIQLPLPATIGEDVLLVPPGDRPNVHAAKGAVDEELGVEAGVAILVGGEGLVVPGERVLQQRPGWTRRAEAARGGADGQDLPGRRLDLRPGGRGIFAEPGLLEDVLVVVEDHGRDVERHRVEPVILRVVAVDRLEEVGPVDRDLLLLHQPIDRDNGVGQNHTLRADLVDLNDVGRGLLPDGGHGGGQHLRVRPLVENLNLELPLALVELLHQLTDRLAELAVHGMPEVNLRFGLGDNSPGKQGKRRDGSHADGASDKALLGVFLPRASVNRTDGNLLPRRPRWNSVRMKQATDYRCEKGSFHRLASSSVWRPARKSLIVCWF